MSHTTSSAPEAPSTLKARVNARSAELGLTRNELARAVGVSRTTLFEWLRQDACTPQGWAGLAAALDLDPLELVAHATPTPLNTYGLHRNARGLTIGELALAAGVSARTVRMLESGGRVRADAAARVGATLGMPPQADAAHRSATSALPLAQLLDETRIANGWTVADVARMLGVTRQLVSAWLRGRAPIATTWDERLAQLTGVTVEELQVMRKI